MRYLKEREEFIKNNKFSNYSLIKEDSGPLANDIPWGDSLLGRLINSVIRKAGIGINITKIDSLTKKLKETFDSIINDAKIHGSSMSEETLSKIDKLKISALLGILKKEVDGDKSKETIVHVTNSTIDAIKSLSVSKNSEEGKKELLSKLSEFLKSLEIEPKEEPKEKGKSEETNKESEKNDIKSLPPGSKEDIKALPVGSNADKSTDVAVVNKDVNNNSKKDKIQAKIDSLKKIITDKRKAGEDTKSEEHELEVFKKGSTSTIKDSYLYTSYLGFTLNESEENTQEEIPATENPKQDKPTDEPVESKNPFKILWNKLFPDEYMKKWITTKEEIQKLEKEVDTLTKNSTKIVINGIDPILEIVKVFNRAYKIYTTSVIESGRKDGKVSNKTFREYTWVGEGDGGSPAAPKTGAWRNNTLFDKWEEAVLDIIKDSKYQVLFNEDTTIKVGSADPRINVIKGTKKQGGGKALLTFINAMLDGSKLYKAGAQAKFIQEYFNVEVPTESLGWSNDAKSNNKVAEEAVNDKAKKKYSFKPIKDISSESVKTFYAINVPNKKYYVYITGKDNDYVYLKYSESFFPINSLAKTIADISKGEMDTIQMKERKDDDSKFEVFYGRIRSTEFPLAPGKDIKLKSLNIDKYTNSENEKDRDLIKSEEVNWGKIDKIYGVISAENKLFILPDDKSKTISGKDDKYKEKLNK